MGPRARWRFHSGVSAVGQQGCLNVLTGCSRLSPSSLIKYLCAYISAPVRVPSRDGIPSVSSVDDLDSRTRFDWARSIVIEVPFFEIASTREVSHRNCAIWSGKGHSLGSRILSNQAQH